jgi:thioredoxin reductase (NADPH)
MTGAALSRRIWRQFVEHGGRWLRGELRELRMEPTGCSLEISGDEPVASPWRRSLRARALILAPGVRRRTLGVPGERELAGLGLLATAAQGTEDLAGKRVVIVGGGDSACENALILARAGARVVLVHRGERLSARSQFAREVAHSPIITLRLRTAVRSFLGAQRLEGIEVEEGGRVEILPAHAALVRVGWIPNSELLPGRWLDPEGYVRADTSGAVEGEGRVFAAGDVLGRLSPSVATSFGSGATAARAAAGLLDRAD